MILHIGVKCYEHAVISLSCQPHIVAFVGVCSELLSSNWSMIQKITYSKPQTNFSSCKLLWMTGFSVIWCQHSQNSFQVQILKILNLGDNFIQEKSLLKS